MLKFKCIADGNSDNDSDTSGAAGGGVAGGTPPPLKLGSQENSWLRH